VDRVRDLVTWQGWAAYDGNRFFAGEVEPCINGQVGAVGAYFALLATKDHVNVFLYDGAIVPDPAGIITGGQHNTTARTMAVRAGEPINAAAFTTMVRQIIANNRAGGWRKLKPGP
jgi:hypothetical protein